MTDPHQPGTPAGTDEGDLERRAALSEVLGGTLLLTQLAGLREQVAGLYMEQIPIRADSPYVGRTLGDTTARTLTRCSVVAIIRDAGVIPAPVPADRLGSGDTLVAVGTREGLDKLVRILAGG